MSYLSQLEEQSRSMIPVGSDIDLPKGAAYASYFPAWEAQTPQYIQPAVYQTEQAAFRQNEFVYSIIIKRAMAEGKGRLRVNDDKGEHPKEITDHKLIQLIRHPNKNMTENDFWGIKRISQDLAGFSAWEIEYNILGEPLRLWFMRPDWCSFRRSQQDPLAYIRYQPYGLAPMDIPLVDEQGRQKILFFSNPEDFDPLFPGVRFYSPAMHALNQIKVDNAMTFFLADFVEHGAKAAGLLSVSQTIDENVSQDYQRRWVQQHGGAENWSKPIVLGLGATYQQLQMNFKDMAFSELDARTETRICNTFNMETIVADARAGLDVSSYNNKKEAVKDWYYGWVSDTWETNGETMTNEMIPIYEGNDSTLFCDFDVSRVYAMQEDRTAMWTRAGNLYKDRVAMLDEAREEAMLKPMGGEEGKSFFVQATIRDQQLLTPEGDVTGQAEQPPVDQAKQEAQVAEEKKFKAYSKRRIKENHPENIPHYEFKFLPVERQHELIREAIVMPVKSKLDALLEKG